MSAAQQAMAKAGDAIDEKLRRDTIEGESSAFELMDRYADAVMADEVLAKLARERALRLEKRAAANRDVIERMLIALELGEPLERATYTASLGHRSTAVITDASLLPDELVKHSPDMRLITKVLLDGVSVDGATLSNPEPHLILGTK